MELKVRELQGKLTHFAHRDAADKQRLRALHQMIAKLQQRAEETAAEHDHRISALADSLRKVESALRESMAEVEVEEGVWGGRVAKAEKAARKALEKLGRERKEADRKMQATLEGYLIELTSFKGRANSSCQASIRELRELEKEVEGADREAKRQAQLNADIAKKIYAQFTTQIDEISNALAQQQRTRQQQEQQLLDSIERSYARLSTAVSEQRKNRENHEREIVDLLERVIEKLKQELLAQ